MFLLVAAMHRQNDGLWFQGDAPRHAMNGLFWWDLLKQLPHDPVEFALAYYARYPVINPAVYPPLFYIFEGAAFDVLGPSPQVAKAIVLLFAATAGLYTIAWTRRWIGPLAGWSGAFLAFIPPIVVWSNTVMLNVPATALGLAAVYHFRRWLESPCRKQLALAVMFLTATLLTYYPAASVLFICAAWAPFHGRHLHRDRRILWIAAGASGALVPLVMALLLSPVHTSRHLPTIAFLTDLNTWTFYWRMLPDILGGPLLALGLIGGATGLLITRWRNEAAYLASWVIVLIVGLSLLPARDPRYILLVAPAFLIAATIGLAIVARRVAPLHAQWQAALLAAGLTLGLWSAARVHVPDVSGFREIATYLHQHAPKEPVLYDGDYAGVFGFYVRASDPNFDRRLVLPSQLLYHYGPGRTFRLVERSKVTSIEDVSNLLRTRSGSRWVAIEVGRQSGSLSGRRLLRETVAGPEFELVRSFPITGSDAHRVDLYRMVGAVAPVAAVDLRFPSHSSREFRHIVPITR